MKEFIYIVAMFSAIIASLAISAIGIVGVIVFTWNHIGPIASIIFGSLIVSIVLAIWFTLSFKHF